MYQTWNAARVSLSIALRLTMRFPVALTTLRCVRSTEARRVLRAARLPLNVM